MEGEVVNIGLATASFRFSVPSYGKTQAIILANPIFLTCVGQEARSRILHKYHRTRGQRNAHQFIFLLGADNILLQWDSNLVFSVIREIANIDL